MKRSIGQHTAPTVKNHHRLRARFNLCIQIGCHGIGVNRQHFVHQVRALVQHGLDESVVAGASALDHVASQCPGAARKTNQRHSAIQGFANRRDCIEHITKLVHVWHFKLGNGGFVAHRCGKTRAFAKLK